MNPFERWDDWEWDRAAQELGRSRRRDSWRETETPGPRRYQGPRKTSNNFVERWTGSQKRVALSALLFLTIVFSSQGEDLLSRGVYALYQTGLESGNVYVAINNKAKEAMGISTQGDAVKVNVPIQQMFYPPVAGPIKVAYGGSGLDGTPSSGIEIGSDLGTPVLCPAEGVVVAVEQSATFGNVVRVNFGNGWEGVLGNLGEVSVNQGTPVAMGMKLGTVGIGSLREKPWLYLSFAYNNQPVNPIPYLIQNK